jgi:glycosyltransferase involved in cell wall biosynthesis
MTASQSPQRRVRVVHIAQSAAGGIASYFEEIAGYQSSWFGADNVAFLVPAAGKHLPCVNPEQLIYFGSGSRSASALFEFARTVRATIRRLKPDIVHVHSSFAGAIVRSMLAGTGQRPRVIYCPHGWAFAMETSGAKKRAYAFVERCLAAVTDLIHVNSRSEYDLAIHAGLPAAKIRILPNGIAWTPAPRRDVGQGPLRVVFIGRHDRQKGVDILLDTISRFSTEHIHFEIAGDGILSAGVSGTRATRPNITFHGWLSRVETLKLLESADAVVMPSRWDAAPIVATEAMRAGVPVIGSNRGAIPEIVAHGVGGCIFDLDDPDALGRVLQSLDRADLRRLGAGARTRWESHYQSDAMNELTCQVYDEVLSRTQPRAQIDAGSELSTLKRSYGA